MLQPLKSVFRHLERLQHSQADCSHLKIWSHKLGLCNVMREIRLYKYSLCQTQAHMAVACYACCAQICWTGQGPGSSRLIYFAAWLRSCKDTSSTSFILTWLTSWKRPPTPWRKILEQTSTAALACSGVLFTACTLTSKHDKVSVDILIFRAEFLAAVSVTAGLWKLSPRLCSHSHCAYCFLGWSIRMIAYAWSQFVNIWSKGALLNIWSKGMLHSGQSCLVWMYTSCSANCSVCFGFHLGL